MVKNSLLMQETQETQTGDSGDTGSILDWEESPGERNGNPLQYSYLGNPNDRGSWWAIVHGITKSQT